MSTTNPPAPEAAPLPAVVVSAPARALPTRDAPGHSARSTATAAPLAPPDRPARPSAALADHAASQPDGAGEGRGAADAGGLPPRPANTRYQSLDLWRGAACVMLLVYHATFYGDYQFRLSDPSTWTWAGVPLHVLRHCWFGVPIFFVISGYCIAASVDSLRRRPHSLRDYFVRRFRRIYPPLWIMCGLAVLYTWCVTRIPAIQANCPQLPDLAAMSAWQWLGNLLAAESWRPNLVGGEPAYLMGNTWTLCYEEQFYFVTGLLLAVSGRRFFQLVAWLTVVVFVGRHVLRGLGVPQAGFFWDGHWLMFAAGILVYHALNYTSSRRRWGALGVLAAGMAYAAIERVAARDFEQKHLGEYLFVACAFALALLFLKKWDHLISRHRLCAPLRWCGQRSYSIYLTHYLLVVVASSWLALGGLRSEWQVATLVVPACMILSLPAAVLFYELVERRFVNPPVESRGGEGRGGERLA